jgi:glycosyltransferase involved in cell wall biosynthesis
MKIAVWHNLPSGGGKRALYYHVRGLVERGHEITCWSLDTADQSYLPLSEFALEHVVSSQSRKGSRKQIAGDSADYYRAINDMRAFDEASRRCAREIEAGDFDLLFANSALPYHVPFIVRHVRIPRVLYLQEPCRGLYEAAPILPWVAGAEENLERAYSLGPEPFKVQFPRLQALRLQAKQEWSNVKACDEVLVNSYFSRESVFRTYGIDSKVCYLGIDTSLFRDLALDRERFVVGLGSFHSTKGIDLALKAMALLPQPRPSLVWISNSGSKSYKEEMNKLACSLAVELTVKEAISDAELVTILNTATLLVYTSRLEPFGFAPLEANACGLPVVAVAEGGVRETIRDGINGFLVDPEPAAIARVTNRLLQNPDLARQIGQQAAAHVQQIWNLESSVDRLEAFLQKAVSTRPSRAKLNGKRVEIDPKGAACTIIAKNYIAFARTLAQSFLSFHPDHKFYVLIVDEFKGYLNLAEECFEVVRLTDLEIPNLPSFCFKYDVKELCTAAKPFLIDYLIRAKGVDRILYLDPDVLITARLEPLYKKLEIYDIVLTPHLDKDYPDDGLLPDDGYILRAGVFNLGFIGLNSSENAASFLTWWKSKLYNGCVIDVPNGYFVDQKFIDLAPIFFGNLFVEKDTGYNVAYWNLHSRKISRHNGTWLCNGSPMYFFHFSGYTLESSEISDYLPRDLSRHHFSNRRDLRPLFDEYKKLVVRNGHRTAMTWPYTFAYFKTGEAIPLELRIQYRNCPSKWRWYGNPFTSKRLKDRANPDTTREATQIPPESEGGQTELQVDESTPVARATPDVDRIMLESEAEQTGSRAGETTLRAQLTAEEELNKILNSRAWRWASRYGRFKYRFLIPVYDLLRRPFGKKSGKSERGSRAGEATLRAQLTAEEKLNKILNSRAWRWASRYGRFKYRFLIPVYDLLRRPFGKKSGKSEGF